MRLLHFLAIALVPVLAFAPGEVAAQIEPPPITMWELRQNDPNPFCSNPGTTQIDLLVLQSSRVELIVLSSDGSQVVRTLVDMMLDVGMHRVIWDGRDASNVPLSNGTYPYRMTATNAESTVLFQDTKVMTVECIVGVQPNTWRCVKQHYR